MKIAQEYKGYYLDVFYKDGIVNGVIQQTQEQLQGMTIEEVVREFKKKVNLLGCDMQNCVSFFILKSLYNSTHMYYNVFIS